MKQPIRPMRATLVTETGAEWDYRSIYSGIALEYLLDPLGSNEGEKRSKNNEFY